MKRVALVAVALALGGSPAFAGHRVTRHSPDCQPFNSADLGTSYTFTKVTPGQMNFLRGIWAVSPKLPGDFPPGDGAAILRKDKSRGGEIAFMDGAKVCVILPAPEHLLKILGGIRTGIVDDDGVEL